ncbi:MAG: alanine--tRNA ligase [Oscillospiraceae bacterium]|jgi:alanyl-tRNA synthetase
MEQLGLNELREKFLSFFESKGHLRHKSFPLLPQGDNSLLLINSGMAPLKPYFSGEMTPPSKRMTTCQKCIRTPDIERVGKTSRHGTFFEMLGNFSFGDYFKQEATAWAWEFITKELQIPVDRLYVTVYLDDDETYDIWTKEVGVDPSHISRLGKADNFWEIGSGPCGPCSEIYFDRGEQYSCGSPDCKVGCDCDRYVEFWNLVFTQFYNDGNGNYSDLKQKNIDTGMGLERLACIMQDVESLFDVDTVMRITQHVSRITGTAYGQSDKIDVSLRVITDHIRSTTMMICDGILPSNEGRGYVLRRLLRRAARHGRLLGVERPFLYEVCETVIAESKAAYPELEEKKDYIIRIIRMEEERFSQTIDAGLKILVELMEAMEAKGEMVLSGSDAFKLYDTYGFPIDLTIEILEEKGLTVNRPEFDAEMELQRKRARAATAALGDFGWESLDLGLDKQTETEFTGYVSRSEDAKILAIVVNGELRASAFTGEQALVILDKTPFYAESGGQVADHGVIQTDSAVLRVENVQKSKDEKWMHIGTVTDGAFHVEDMVRAEIDWPRRRAVMRAHSATHLLQKALRNVLGTHVEQAGSLVEPDHLRFDFTHFTAITPEEAAKAEAEVNDMILEGLPIETAEMSQDEAKKQGAMALFGEKYGAVVRVVSVGDYSVELCGGTHLDNTAQIGSLRIHGDYSVAAGVRRIEASVGKAVLEEMHRQEEKILRLAEAMKTMPDQLEERIIQTTAELKELRRQAEQAKAKASAEMGEDLLQKAVPVGNVKLLTAQVEHGTADNLRAMGDYLREKEASIVAVLAGVEDQKIVFLTVSGKEAIAQGIKAGDLVKVVSKAADGSGGGKPDSAMGGGKSPEKLGQAFEAARMFTEDKINAGK